MKLLVTGAAGFIGSHVSLALAARGDKVIGIDNINPKIDDPKEMITEFNANLR